VTQEASSRPSQVELILAAARRGWLSARANALPGLVIVLVAAMVVMAYYLSAEVHGLLESLQALRERSGLWFSMAASAVGAGLIPGLYLILIGQSRKGPAAWVDLGYTTLVWVVSTITIDRFYVFQNWLWGPAITLPVILGKVAVDQFIFTPLIGLQIPAIGFRLRDSGYSLAAIGNALRNQWLLTVIIPMLVACWLTWIPGTLVIYSLPLPLQVPMMILIQCFFSLVMAHASAKVSENQAGKPAQI
jgi:hypothetical protein